MTDCTFNNSYQQRLAENANLTGQMIHRWNLKLNQNTMQVGTVRLKIKFVWLDRQVEVLAMGVR